MKKFFIYTLAIILPLVVLVFLLSLQKTPEHITYGASFSKLHADELHLDWKETYQALLNDLGVKHLRLSAHWPMVEPVRGEFHFDELDYQVSEAESHGADVVLAVGRRAPGWPECHVPGWAGNLSWEDQKEELRLYIRTILERYKNSPAVLYWQVENEPYLSLFAHEQCGDLDEAFLQEEIALVHSLDPTRKVLVTDSGNLGTWVGAYRGGDAFGTSVYVYFWTPELGPFKTVLPPAFYRIKNNLMRIAFGSKPSLLIELSTEPWLVEPVADAPIEVQYSRMDIDKFNGVIAYAESTRYDRQYLWGAEWWYYMKGKGHSEFWERAQELYTSR